jgi:hypothetical protein
LGLGDWHRHFGEGQLCGCTVAGNNSSLHFGQACHHQVVHGQYKIMQMHMPNVVGGMNVHELKTLHRLQVVSSTTGNKVHSGMNWQEGQHKVAAQKSTTIFFKKQKGFVKKKVNYLFYLYYLPLISP